MLEIIAKAGLFFCQTFVIVSIIIVGFLCNEKVFGRALFLVTFTLMYNVYLKSIWQIPLPGPLEGWAFPSGHMHTAVVFWGWLAFEFHKVWLYEISFFLLCLVGYGIVYHGYHYPIDVLGAFGFGILSITMYAFLQRLSFFSENPYRLGYVFTLLGLIILLLLPSEGRKPHMWAAYGALIGFTLAWHYTYKPKAFFNPKELLVQLGIMGVGFLAIMLLTNQLKQFEFSVNAFHFIKFLLIGLWLALSKGLSKKLMNKIFKQPSVVPKALRE